MGWRFVAQLAVVLVSMVMFVLLAMPTAQAGTLNYCGVLLSVNQWCLRSVSHTYDRNSGAYYGSTNINLCAKLIAPNTSPEFQYDRRCFYGLVVQSFSDGFG